MPQKTKEDADIISAITQAAACAYGEHMGLPEGAIFTLVDCERYEIKRLARSFADVLSKNIMENAGPQLIQYWSHQGCPGLPALKK